MADVANFDVCTHMPYLARDDLYALEKPYGADFPVDHFEHSKIANHVFDAHEVTIYDARARNDFRLDENGFCFIKRKTTLLAEDASNERTSAMDRYLKEIESVLYQHFPEYSRIEVMDFQIRKRAAGFPESIGTKVDFEQPAGMPHTDFSIAGAFMRMEEAFPGQKQHYVSKSFDLLNVWRVLKGPNDDWPLALCDYQTVDVGKDVVANDCLHQTRVGENWLLHANAAHRWYYLSGQQEEDLIVFRNVNSLGEKPRAFHSAFNNARSNGQPRHSVEVRVVAFC